MTVKEVIERLQKMPQDKQVAIWIDENWHWDDKHVVLEYAPENDMVWVASNKHINAVHVLMKNLK